MQQMIYGRAFQTTRTNVSLALDFFLDYTGKTVFNGKSYAEVCNKALLELRKNKVVGKVRFTYSDPKRLG